ncbi:hypothetical protein DPEC_G00023710 [Dallia pectoralis]|uniref:Uncharacterized protein n=1 Tax=Dallia pectoralis TaxID=75939 RepID=A0ACC2HGS3_DALPE|nr:hypothetical protein DPEC_G00023710 [Dallia pectoralis]
MLHPCALSTPRVQLLPEIRYTLTPHWQMAEQVLQAADLAGATRSEYANRCKPTPVSTERSGGGRAERCQQAAWHGCLFTPGTNEIGIERVSSGVLYNMWPSAVVCAPGRNVVRLL